MKSSERPAANNEYPIAKEAAAEPAAKPERLMSLDAYRGLIMVTLAGSGFGILELADEMGTELWGKIGFHFDHPTWLSAGPGFTWFGSYWDMIQPSFMFMVGVAMPFSFASRHRKGDSPGRMFAHAAIRAAVLVMLGVFLSSRSGSQTNFVFANVLCQIGLGYLFVYLLLGRTFGVQLAAAAAILVGSWGAFMLYRLPGADFDFLAAGINLQTMPEWFAHWAKNANAFSAFDVWFLNLFPREEVFEFNSGGYTTLNFVPAIATMLLGVMAGQLLRGPRTSLAKFLLLVLGGAVCMGLAVAAGHWVCPIVKRIWTPSWVLFAGAWTLWMLALLYLVIDVIRLRFWAVPLAIVGMNSILMYMMSQSIKPWTARMLDIHFGQLAVSVKARIAGRLATLEGWTAERIQTDLGEEFFDGLYGSVVQDLSVLLVFWLICWWLYRQKVFLRI